MPETEELYWDSNVFLTYINGGPPDRVAEVEPILDAADGKRLRILTSTLTIAEVAYAKHEIDTHQLEVDVEKKIDALWSGHPGITFIEMHSRIALDARNLIRSAVSQRIARPSGADAVHLASARTLGVKVFHTYDHLTQYEPLVGFTIEEPTASQPYLSPPGEPSR